ncbi:hypothetical protein RI367_003029 [Sorochytrium milnesiophthora]
MLQEDSAKHVGAADADSRLSLLDIVRDNISADAIKQSLYRVIVCGQTISSPDTKHDTAGFHQRILAKLQEDGEQATGILLGYQTCWIHLLEASPSAVRKLLREYNVTDPQRLKSTRVLSLEDEIHMHIQCRLFPSWAYKAVDRHLKPDQTEADDAYFKADELARTTAKTCKGLFEVGVQWTVAVKTETRTPPTPDSVFEKAVAHIPDMSTVYKLSTSDDGMSVTDWLEAFLLPRNLVLESEQAWPAPSLSYLVV